MSAVAPGIDANGASQPLRVVLVDDHEVLRAGTRQVLECSDDILVVGEAEDGAAAMQMVTDLQPDVVLIDVKLRDGDGIDVARHLTATQPDVRVVILSAYSTGAFVRAALEVGASGYLLKTMPRDELVEAVRAAGTGMTVLDPALSAELGVANRSSNSTSAARLTGREAEVVELVADGLSNKTIAARLGVSVRTIEGHLNHAFAKLGIDSRTELVRLVLTRDAAVDGRRADRSR